MKSYGQFCPVAKAAEIFCERWTALILRDLAAGAQRFAELRRGVPLMSPTLLSRRLRQLEAGGVLERRAPRAGRGFTYHLTRAGQEFAPLVQALGVWGQRWSRRDLARNEVDLWDSWSGRWSARSEATRSGPGADVDVYLSATLPDMIRIVRGDLKLGARGGRQAARARTNRPIASTAVWASSSIGRNQCQTWIMRS